MVTNRSNREPNLNSNANYSNISNANTYRKEPYSNRPIVSDYNPNSSWQQPCNKDILAAFKRDMKRKLLAVFD